MKPADHDLRYLTLRQAAEVLHCCGKTVLALVDTGDILGFRVHSSGPSKWLIQEKSLIQFILRRQAEATGSKDFEK